MTVEVRINGALIAQADVINETGLAGADDVNTYRWTFQGEHGRRLHDTVEHRYGDGAVLLAEKVITAVALRYRVAGCYTRAPEQLPEAAFCSARQRGHDGECEPPL